jgi:prefoldin alpha subunit
MSTKKIIKKTEGKGEDKSRSNQAAGENNYLKLQMIDQQVRQLQQYLQTFDQQVIEIKSVISSLKELSALKKGDLIFAPVANGIFIKAKLEDNQEVKVNVGHNTVVTKSIDNAVKMLQGQEAEITQYRSDVLAKFDELIKQAEELQQ